MSRVEIDWRRCRGHGACSAALPELVSLDQHGYPVISDPQVPEELAGAARAGQWTCPAAALRVRA
ncbi:MAG: ferredoxin [Candidatus Nanopelagicales bacterium]